MERRPPLAARRIVVPRRYAAPETGGIHFSTTELVSILVSMVTLILAFQMFKIADSGIILGILLGVTLHEIVHKIVAQSMGFESRYKLWEIGLVLIIAFAIITKGRFIFAAPGFVVTEGMATPRERGIISMSAPTTNILLALLFMAAGGAWMSAAYVNALLAVFNLLPIPPLDGAAVMEWNPGVWSGTFCFALLVGAFFLL